jgi:integrase
MRNNKSRRQWLSSVEHHARTLLNKPITEIDQAVINAALEPSFRSGQHVTASRVASRIKTVCDWVAAGRPAPRRTGGEHVKHHAAVPYADIPEFMQELREKEAMSARALEFVILTAARTGEVIGAIWDEIDIENATWHVPAERMKAGRAHDVPLSRRTLELLRSMPRVKGNRHLFPGTQNGAPIGGSVMLHLLKSMRPGAVPHGFRSSFRDWAGDHTSFPKDVIEAALAHRVKNRTEAAYRRSSALEKRRLLMEAWAKYCDMPAHSKAVALHG